MLDRSDRTVPGLTAEDFEIHAGGKWFPVDTLDVRCSDTGHDDPRGVRNTSNRTPMDAPDEGRRVVLAFDYLPQDEIIHAISDRPASQSVVVTGRGGGSALQAVMDTVSEVKEIKHAFKAGIMARKGVDY